MICRLLWPSIYDKNKPSHGLFSKPLSFKNKESETVVSVMMAQNPSHGFVTVLVFASKSLCISD